MKPELKDEIIKLLEMHKDSTIKDFVISEETNFNIDGSPNPDDITIILTSNFRYHRSDGTLYPYMLDSQIVPETVCRMLVSMVDIFKGRFSFFIETKYNELRVKLR
jgi:hypothetical protein